MLHIPPTNLFLLAAKQEPHKKSLPLYEKYGTNFLENVQENGPAGRVSEYNEYCHDTTKTVTIDKGCHDIMKIVTTQWRLSRYSED